MDRAENIKEFVSEKCAAVAERVARGGASSCCGAKDRGLDAGDPILYDASQVGDIPEKAVLA